MRPTRSVKDWVSGVVLGVAAVALVSMAATTLTANTQGALAIEDCETPRTAGSSGTAGAGGLMRGVALAEMTAGADVVLAGSVVSIQGCVAGSGDIMTLVSVAPESTLKGSGYSAGSGVVTVVVPGGEHGGYRLAVGDSPEFAAGERVVVFLKEYAGAGLALTHGFQSKLTVSGGTVGDTGLALDEFSARVAQALGGSLAEGDDPLAGAGIVEQEFATLPAKWKGGDFPMAIHINADSNRPSQVSAAQMRQAVANAFHTWQELEGSFITFGPFVKTTRQSGADECSGAQMGDGFTDVTWKISGAHSAATLAITKTCFMLSNPPDIMDSDIEIDTDHFGSDWVTSGSASCDSGRYDLETVLLHEFGHFIGLDHPSNTDCNPGQNGLCPVMNAFYGGRQQTVCADDVAGATGLYPNGTTSPAPPVPANLRAGPGTAQLALAWENVETERGYEIWRADGPCAEAGDGFYLYDAVGRDLLTYTDIGYGNGIPSGDTYCYRIRSYNTHAYSAFSNTTDATEGATPAPVTATPAPPKVQGDTDCDSDSDTIDGLFVLRFVAGMTPVAQCIDSGDVDCDGDEDSTDALRILRFVAGNPLKPPPGCPPVGAAAARR